MASGPPYPSIMNMTDHSSLEQQMGPEVSEIAQVLSGLEQGIVLGSGNSVEKAEVYGEEDAIQEVASELLQVEHPSDMKGADSMSGDQRGKKRRRVSAPHPLDNQPQPSGTLPVLPFPENTSEFPLISPAAYVPTKQEGDPSDPSPLRRKRRSWVARKTVEKNVSRFSHPELHIPIRCSTGNMSKHCKVCNLSRPVTMCSECDVFVCIEAIGTERCPTIKETCWYALHHEKSFVAHQAKPPKESKE